MLKSDNIEMSANLKKLEEMLYDHKVNFIYK